MGSILVFISSLIVFNNPFDIKVTWALIKTKMLKCHSVYVKRCLSERG